MKSQPIEMTPAEIVELANRGARHLDATEHGLPDMIRRAIGNIGISFCAYHWAIVELHDIIGDRAPEWMRRLLEQAGTYAASGWLCTLHGYPGSALGLCRTALESYVLAKYLDVTGDGESWWAKAQGKTDDYSKLEDFKKQLLETGSMDEGIFGTPRVPAFEKMLKQFEPLEAKWCRMIYTAGHGYIHPKKHSAFCRQLLDLPKLEQYYDDTTDKWYSFANVGSFLFLVHRSHLTFYVGKLPAFFPSSEAAVSGSAPFAPPQDRHDDCCKIMCLASIGEQLTSVNMEVVKRWQAMD